MFTNVTYSPLHIVDILVMEMTSNSSTWLQDSMQQSLMNRAAVTIPTESFGQSPAHLGLMIDDLPWSLDLIGS